MRRERLTDDQLRTQGVSDEDIRALREAEAKGERVMTDFVSAGLGFMEQHTTAFERLAK